MYMCIHLSVLCFLWRSYAQSLTKIICCISKPRFCCTLISDLAEKTNSGGKAYPVERSHTELCSKEWNSCIIWFQTYTFLQDFNCSSRLLKTFSIEITKNINTFHRCKISISIFCFIFPLHVGAITEHFVENLSQELFPWNRRV